MQKISHHSLLALTCVAFIASCRMLYIHGPHIEDGTGSTTDTSEDTSSSTGDPLQSETATSDTTAAASSTTTDDTDGMTASTAPIDDSSSTSGGTTDGDAGCIGCAYPCGNGEIDGEEQCDQGSENGKAVSDSFDDAECTKKCTIGVLRAFITSTSHNGNLGGIEGADKTCQELAQKLNNPGKFIAWLAGPDDYNAYAILKECKIPYYRVDNKRIAPDGESIILNPTGPETHLLSISQAGDPITEANVWSCIDENGANACGDYFCGEWDSVFKSMDNYQGRVGRSGDNAIVGNCKPDTTNRWTDCSQLSCAAKAHLYCFEKCPQ